MLINRHDLEGIAKGAITLAFRRWKRPTVRAGGQLRTPIGVLAIDSVDHVKEAEISRADALAAGFSSREALIAQLRRRAVGEIYRIGLRLSGPDPREALRRRARLSDDEVAELSQRLARYDSRSRRGPWAQSFLRLIAEHPGTRAADLAAMAEVDKAWFKSNVRKLKELGLTESLSPGYRLSPRGRAYIRCVERAS